MSTITVLYSIIQIVNPSTLILAHKESELRIFGTKNIDMHLAVSRSGASNRLERPVEVGTQQFQRILKECKLFSDIEFSQRDKVARLCIDQGAYKLQLECFIKTSEEISPPALTAEIVADLNVKLLKSVTTKDAHSVEILFKKQSVEVRINGPVRVEAVQKPVNYIRKKEKEYVFIIPSEGFSVISKLCQLEPNRVLLGVVKNISIFYLYYKDITGIFYLPGTLLEVPTY